MKRLIFSVVIGIALASLMMVPAHQALAVPQIEFVHPNDGDNIKGKNLAVVIKTSGFDETKQWGLQITVRNVIDTGSDFATAFVEFNDKTPIESGPFKFVKTGNPNKTSVILVDKDSFQDNTDRVIQITIRNLASPDGGDSVTSSITVHFD